MSDLHSVAATRHASEIRAGRISRGLTQRAVADAVGARLQTYQKWEYGYRDAPADVREQLAGLLGLDRARLGLDPDRACPCCGQAYG